MWQCVALCCDVLQRATRLLISLVVVTFYTAGVLRCDAACCFSVLQCVAVCGSVWQCVAVCCDVLQRATRLLFSLVVVTFYTAGVLRCDAACCFSVWQCVAVCCDVLQQATRLSMSFRLLLLPSTLQVCCGVMQRVVSVCCSVSDGLTEDTKFKHIYIIKVACTDDSPDSLLRAHVKKMCTYNSLLHALRRAFPQYVVKQQNYVIEIQGSAYKDPSTNNSGDSNSRSSE